MLERASRRYRRGDLFQLRHEGRVGATFVCNEDGTGDDPSRFWEVIPLDGAWYYPREETRDYLRTGGRRFDFLRAWLGCPDARILLGILGMHLDKYQCLLVCSRLLDTLRRPLFSVHREVFGEAGRLSEATRFAMSTNSDEPLLVFRTRMTRLMEQEIPKRRLGLLRMLDNLNRSIGYLFWAGTELERASMLIAVGEDLRRAFQFYYGYAHSDEQVWAYLADAIRSSCSLREAILGPDA